MADPDDSVPHDSAHPALDTESLHAFFVLGDKVHVIELQIAMNKYALITNSERPGYTESDVHAKIVAENDKLTKVAKVLREARLEIILKTKDNEPWVREMFRLKREKDEAKLKERMVPDSETAWGTKKERDPNDTGVSEEEMISLMQELRLERDEEGYWRQKDRPTE